MASIKSQVASKYQVAVEDLVAVLYYSDRYYTQVTVFGTNHTKIKTNIETDGLLKNETFHANPWKKLKVIPTKGYVVEATIFGLEKGKILIVPGSPPDQ